jgi:probable HAF family extracellular repeat protein
VSGTQNSQGHNLIGDGTGGSGYDSTDLVGTSSDPIDPKLGPLQENGGPTPTMAPLPSSPAIDAGDPTNAPPTDQRGLPRVLDGATDIGAVELQVFHVTSTADAGPGSLRQAVLDANATPGTNGIAFVLGTGGVQTIAPTSPLPAVTNPVEIDGATQPGYAGTPLIELAGESAGPGADGLTLASPDSTVTGLVIGGFRGAGVSISGNGNRVVGNFIGTDATGTMVHPNGTGVAVVYIGSDNLIGGTAPGAGNLISGNLQDGVGMYGGNGNTIQGNFIGTDASGTQALPNGYGVELFSGSANTLGGGTAPGAGNLISGNRYDGIGIYSDGNVIQANRIGTDVTGTAPLGNGWNGVEIQAFAHGHDNLIGGTAFGAGNVIAYNGQDGVLVDRGTGNAIRENSIFANGRLGIELRHHGNHGQAAPVMTSATAGLYTTAMGELTSVPDTTFTVEFFATPGGNPTGRGEGERYIGSTTVVTDASGRASFTAFASHVEAGEFLTATATDPAGDTSKFSARIPVRSGPGVTTLDVPGANFTYARGINDAGQIVGFYSADGLHGFLLSSGIYTTLDVPAAAYTEPEGINDAGQIVGVYIDTIGSPGHGFLLSGGIYTTLDVPDSVNTEAVGINDAGQIMGHYQDTTDFNIHGFVLSGGNYITLDVPGAVSTEATGINDAGQIVGYYQDADFNTHGFLLSGGIYTTLDVPGATGTQANGINNAGQIVGFDDAGSFLLSGGSYSTLEVPGAESTSAFGINAAGQIVGDYNDAAGGIHGFVAPAPSSGPRSGSDSLLSPLDLPLASIGLGVSGSPADANFQEQVSGDDSAVLPAGVDSGSEALRCTTSVQLAAPEASTSPTRSDATTTSTPLAAVHSAQDALFAAWGDPAGDGLAGTWTPG